MTGMSTRKAGIWVLCFMLHLTFFKVTNSFSAQGRRASSSSYLWEGGALPLLSVGFGGVLLVGGHSAALGPHD